MKSMIRKMGRQAVSWVNFESMNRVPPLRGLVEVKGEIVKGMENVWYEYVPASYTEGKKVPLVVQLHGGGHDGKRWAGMTVWLVMEQVASSTVAIMPTGAAGISSTSWT